MRCNCSDWFIGTTAQHSIETIAWTHGIDYDGPMWKYCPWCGKKLGPVDNANSIPMNSELEQFIRISKGDDNGN